MGGFLVIGGGIAGQAVCEAVRDIDPDTPLTLVCGEPHLPYDRVQLSTLLVAAAHRVPARLQQLRGQHTGELCVHDDGRALRVEQEQCDAGGPASRRRARPSCSAS